MTRLFNLIYGEIKFLLKYGIIGLYIISTLLYILFISFFTGSAKNIISTILIFTDPAAMGLFFMGAIILLEKSQRVNSSLAISPIKIHEYIIAKIIPLMMIGVLVGIIIKCFSNISNIALIIIGVALSSIIFSLCGLFVAVKSITLNSFLILTVPFELVICLPALLSLFKVISSPFWLIHPGVAAIQLISGTTHGALLSVISLLFWIVVCFLICKKAVKKYFFQMGGVKL